MRSWAAKGPLIALIGLALILSAPGLSAATPVTPTAENPAIIMEIELTADGNAHWTVTYLYRLETDDERAAFDRMLEEYVANESAPLTIEPFQEAASQASIATDREMTVDNSSRRGSRADGVGRLVLTFRWTAFAPITGEEIRVGDVFQTPDGTWLPRLTANQQLLIEFPDGYAPQSLSWPLKNGTVTITGPETLAPGEPAVHLVATGPPSPTVSPTSIVTSPTMSSTETNTDIQSPAGGFTPGLGLATLVLLGVAIGYLVWRQHEPGAGKSTADDHPAGPEPEQSTSPDPSEQAAAAALLSDEERILKLLDDNGGRMRQVTIVEETDWSNAKVSQLLSEMEEAGRVEKLRIGRENLISLPGQAPDGSE